MKNDSTSLLSSRRDMLIQTGGLLALATVVPHTAIVGAEPDKVKPEDTFKPIDIPDWVNDVTRMAFLSPGDIPKAAKAGAQVVHTNLIWPYFPLRRDGGGLSKEDDGKMQALVGECHRSGMKLSLGLPPFPSVSLVKKHPDWRVSPVDNDASMKAEPKEDNLGTRLGCNLGPWGDYLIGVCVELVEDFGVDGFSFDGNYHSALCFCPSCKACYKKDRNRDLPKKINLDDVAYREYLVWRGERLEDHYRRLQTGIKKSNPDAVLMSWTVNAGRYGHFLYSPRAMPTRLNRLFDLPMQEWWLDETNVGASLMPSFGAAYLRATSGGRPAASEPYLMSRGNPYGTNSFPAHERLTRCLLAVSHGNVLAESMGWSGHETSVVADFREIGLRERYMKRIQPLPWAALLVSEQTRQFYAYRDIAERFLPHVLGVFRAAIEEHLPLMLLNDWDINSSQLTSQSVLVLANAAALSDAQAQAIRDFVKVGGGLVATGETSLCDELGRPRADFALADLFGVSYRGRPKGPEVRPNLDENFAIALDESYWKNRTGVATLTWKDHPALDDRRLKQLVPGRLVTMRGPLVRVSEPKQADEVIMRMKPEESNQVTMPAAVFRQFGKGRVVYLAAAIDAAHWSYSYPYQRRLLARAMEWAASTPPSVSVHAPMCVQATSFVQIDKEGDGRRLVVHLFNGLNTTANHGLPSMDVPLREEIVPIYDLDVQFHRDAPKHFHCEPGNKKVEVRNDGSSVIVRVPPLEIHQMLVGEY